MHFLKAETLPFKCIKISLQDLVDFIRVDIDLALLTSHEVDAPHSLAIENTVSVPEIAEELQLQRLYSKFCIS